MISPVDDARASARTVVKAWPVGDCAGIKKNA